MCMINEMKRRIEELETESNNALAEVGRLKARDGRWHAAYVKLTSGDIVVDNGDLVGLCATNDLMLEFDTIAGESPEQSLAEIQALAVDRAVDWLHYQYPHLDGPHLGILTSYVRSIRDHANQSIANPPENS